MRRETPDLLVVGAGIFGLSVAWVAKRRGMRVLVLEAERVEAGASGGIVGALTPHAPSRWRPMMAFQFNALLALEAHAEALEAAAGLAVGYARSGRLTPLVSEKARAGAERDVAAAPETWGARAAYRIVEEVPAEVAGWIRPEAAPFGLVQDTVSARIDPRAYLRALAQALDGDIRVGTPVEAIDAVSGSLRTAEGAVSAPAVVLAAGWQVWPLARQVAGVGEGQPVKGQSALFDARAEHLPVIYQDGLYIIPHTGGRVAVGSTSEKAFDDPLGTDEQLDAVIARARAMCPALEGAEVVERWAGLRPKPPGREPMVGPLSDDGRFWIAAGGFKISFGIAHAVAEAVVDGITGNEPSLPLPETFAPDRNLT